MNDVYGYLLHFLDTLQIIYMHALSMRLSFITNTDKKLVWFLSLISMLK